jgi:hypothetical protein
MGKDMPSFQNFGMSGKKEDKMLASISFSITLGRGRQ